MSGRSGPVYPEWQRRAPRGSPARLRARERSSPKRGNSGPRKRVGAGCGCPWGECPPAPACGRRLLLDFAPRASALVVPPFPVLKTTKADRPAYRKSVGLGKSVLVCVEFLVRCIFKNNNF